MDLNYLQVFYEVAKVGRFTDAARVLNISQSALSRSVALLEERQGVKLFDRSKSGVTLTAVGVEVFRHCEALFQTVQRIEGVCRGTEGSCEGPLRFATTDHVMNDILIEPLQELRAEFPLVVPSITIGSPDEIIATLLNSTCEFGLLFAKVVTPQIDFEPLRDDPMALVVATKLWKPKRGVSASEALDKLVESVGYITSIGSFTQSRPSRVLKEVFGKIPKVAYEVSSQEAQKRLCLAGGGIAYLSRFMVEEEIEDGLLHDIKIEHLHSFKLWLATRKGLTLSQPSIEFINRLRTTWSQGPYRIRD